jgi:membrane protein YqaA with SNARE-associated domain
MAAWGPLGVFMLALLDSAGIPLVGGVDAMLVLLAASTPARAYLSALAALVGSALGCLFLFYLARKGGDIFLARHTSRNNMQKFILWFRSYGLTAVFVPALLPFPPLPTKPFVLCAGALGVGTGPFLLIVVLARAIRYLGLAYLGAQLGTGAMAWLRAHGWHLALIALAMCVLALLVHRAGSRVLQKAKDASS